MDGEPVGGGVLLCVYHTSLASGQEGSLSLSLLKNSLTCRAGKKKEREREKPGRNRTERKNPWALYFFYFLLLLLSRSTSIGSAVERRRLGRSRGAKKHNLPHQSNKEKKVEKPFTFPYALLSFFPSLKKKKRGCKTEAQWNEQARKSPLTNGLIKPFGDNRFLFLFSFPFLFSLSFTLKNKSPCSFNICFSTR